MGEDGLEKITAGFQCFVCGAVFTTDEDRRQHLEKESHGKAHEGAGRADSEIARKQIELNESNTQGDVSTT
jgi:hypothetical protein